MLTCCETEYELEQVKTRKNGPHTEALCPKCGKHLRFLYKRRRSIKPTEHQIQAQIVDTLRLAGLTVYETTAYKQKGPSGVDRGIPDLLVVHPHLEAHFIGIEVKRPGVIKWSSIEQEFAYSRGHFVVAKSALDAIVQIKLLVCTRYKDEPLATRLSVLEEELTKKESQCKTDVR